MRIRTIALAALLHLVPHNAYSDGRVNFGVDFNRTDVAGAYDEVGLAWQGFEFQIEKEFTKSKVLVSGFAVGVRGEHFYAFTGFGTVKDVHRWDEGTYLSLKIFRHFDLSGKKSWALGPSIGILYGIPGTTLDRTIGKGYGDAYEYTHVFPLRNSEVPKLLAEKAELSTNSALFYPEASVALRKKLARGVINLDWIGGVRIIKFGIVDSNSQGDAFSEKRVLIPSVGARVGFRIF